MLIKEGRAFSEKDKTDDALSAFDLAPGIDARNVDALIGKGESLAKNGKFSPAPGCFDSPASIDARNAVAWFRKACAEDQSGREFRAIESCGKFLELADSSKHDTMIMHAKTRLQALGAK